jgi:hypothetical protein
MFQQDWAQAWMAVHLSTSSFNSVLVLAIATFWFLPAFIT